VKKLDFIFFDAGGGHRAAANALSQIMQQQHRPFEVRLVNLQEALDSIDIFRKITGLRLQDVYNLMLKKGWTLGSPQLTAGMHLVIRVFHSQQVKVLQDLWRRNQPDMVVSLVPNLNRALYDSLGRALPGVPVGQVEQLADQHQVLGAGQVLVDARVLAGQADPPADPLRLAQHVDAGHLRVAGIRAQQGGEHPDRGGLAGAVGAEHAEHGAAAHRQVHPVQRLCRLESLAEPFRPHHEIAHDPSSSLAGRVRPSGKEIAGRR